MGKIIFSLGLWLCAFFACSQNVGVNSSGAVPDPTAMLDVSATDKGLLIPRVALTSNTDVATIPSPAVSLMVYNTATAGVAPNDVVPGYYYWNGTNWINMGTTGQSSTSYFSTNGVTITPTTGFTYIPGYPVTITVPSNCNVLISGDCGVQTTAGTTGYSINDLVILIDGAFVSDAFYQRICVHNTSGITGLMSYASMSQAMTLTPGTHTIGFAAAGVGAGFGSNTNVGGNSSS
ncbi:MAG TPA: hypothetical protein VD905_12685, partial [Flavobacteriales bacterium]|nr:hypothetical protein [Flavobacteriales bacterium]